MGLYIPKIKMPKDNCEAIQTIIITNNWIDGEIKILAYDFITNEFIGEVVEIYEPHGDLIDFDTIYLYEDDDGELVARFSDLKDVPSVIEAERE